MTTKENINHISIRPIKSTDEDQISKLYWQTFQYAFQKHLPPQSFKDPQTKKDLIQDLKEKLQTHVGFMAYDDSCACLGFVILSPVPDDNTCTELDKLYISPQAQGKGLGKLFLNFIKEYAQKQGISRLIIWTLKNGPGRPFYEHFGATPSGKEALWVGNSHIVELILQVNSITP